MQPNNHGDDGIDNCENCGDDLDDIGNYVELEYPTSDDDGPGYVSGTLCDDCASGLSADVVADQARSTGIQNLYDQLGVDSPDYETGAVNGGDDIHTDGGDDVCDRRRAALEAALDTVDALQEQLRRRPREMNFSGVEEALDDIDVDGLAPDIEEPITAARRMLEHAELAAGDEAGVIATDILAELAPVAARAAREWRRDPPHPGTASIEDASAGVLPDVDFETAANPMHAFREAMHGRDAPWTLRVLVEVDSEVALQYRPVFEQALENSEIKLYDLLYNYGATDVTLAIDGYDPEYYFEERADKEERRDRRRRRGS
jgi:hypothetical protein